MSCRYVLAFFLAAAAVGLSACGGGGSAPQPTAAPQAEQTAPSRSIQMVMLHSTGTDPVAASQQYDGIIGAGFHQVGFIKTFKQCNPRARVFRYEIAAAASNADYYGPEYKLGYKWIRANHPEWLLLDSAGNEIPFKNYPYVIALDPGNQAYREHWVQQAIANAKQAGADGIMIDNLNSRYDWNFDVIPPKYPDQASFAAAMDGYVRYVVPRIKAAGLLVIGNGSGEYWHVPPWSEWIQLFDGRCWEYSRDPVGLANGLSWHWPALLPSYSAFPDKYYVHCFPRPDASEESRRFVAASIMLWAGPNTYAGVYEDKSGSPVPYHDPLLDIRLGKPLGPCELHRDAVYKREFEHGVVFLNTSDTKVGAADIPAGYSEVSGSEVRAGPREMQPKEALFLRK